MQRLMNVRDIMGQQKERYRPCNLAFVLLGHLPLQNLDAVRNHMHYVPFAAPGVSASVLLRWRHWDVGVMKPMMRRRS